VRKKDKGFSLIEIIIVLVISGIILAVAGMGIVKVTEGLVFTQKNASTALKAQVALTRLEIELHMIDNVTSGNNSTLVYVYNTGPHAGTHTLSYSANNILLDGDILVDNVNSFSLTYFDKYDNVTIQATWNTTTSRIIELNFSLTGTDGPPIPFKIRVVPRPIALPAA
jgi:prepilin-type N-terminal cleavage/methylation domain-containing protein